jgi:hypothetical protein
MTREAAAVPQPTQVVIGKPGTNQPQSYGGLEKDSQHRPAERGSRHLIDPAKVG